MWPAPEAPPALASSKIRATATRRKRRKVATQASSSPLSPPPLPHFLFYRPLSLSGFLSLVRTSAPPRPHCSLCVSLPLVSDEELPLGFINTILIKLDSLSPLLGSRLLFFPLLFALPLAVGWLWCPILLSRLAFCSACYFCSHKVFTQVGHQESHPPTTPHPLPPTEHH